MKKLIPDVSIAIGDLGGVGGNIGAHTTSNARMYHLLPRLSKSEGQEQEQRVSQLYETTGRLVDSPGIRELGVWHLSRDSIREGFKEIDQASKRCKYRNCKHSSGEEGAGGCAVRSAVRNGSIHPLRFQAFQDLMD